MSSDAIAGCGGNAGLYPGAGLVLLRRCAGHGRGRPPGSPHTTGRCPSGSRTASAPRRPRPRPSATSRRRRRRCLPLRAKVTVPPAPAGAALRHREPLQVQPVADARRRPHPLGLVEHALRPAGPGLAFAPVRHLVVQPGQVEPALGRGSRAPATGSRGGRWPARPVRHRTSRRIRWAPSAGGRCRRFGCGAPAFAASTSPA